MTRTIFELLVLKLQRLDQLILDLEIGLKLSDPVDHQRGSRNLKKFHWGRIGRTGPETGPGPAAEAGPGLEGGSAGRDLGSWAGKCQVPHWTVTPLASGRQAEQFRFEGS